MAGPLVRSRFSPIIAFTFGTLLAACHDNNSPSSAPPPVIPVVETPVVVDATGATNIDANLVNPWGLAFSTTGTLWVSDNRTGLATVYDSTGLKKTTVVAIPTAAGGVGGTPTGVVFNTTTTFGGSHWIFATEDGTIAAWTSGTTAQTVANRSTNGAVYKGLALAANGSSSFLFATNFKQNGVDVFDSTFAFVKTFTDASLPAGFAPFGISNIGGKLYVTFAKQQAPANTDDEPGIGNGYVDIFNTDGTIAQHLIVQGSLNSPWGVALAPASFGTLSGDLLVSNFGDGHIGAYNAATGSAVGILGDSLRVPLTIDGLWGLTFGPLPASTTLYFSAGTGAEAHGLVGTIKPK